MGRLETIYVVRHGYRLNWTIDPQTGKYYINFPTPTGIPSDPTLSSYGVTQAKELGAHLISIDPPVDLIYSSPFYRCLQTLEPFVEKYQQKQQSKNSSTEACIHIERGLGEFYGRATFDHPSPAAVNELQKHFAHIRDDSNSIIIPSTKGETIPQLHDRVAYCLHNLIQRADDDPSGPKTLLICSHAAAMIAIGRVLTGRMPDDECEDDFNCFTCSLSKFTRRPDASSTANEKASKWSSDHPDDIPSTNWRGGNGVMGGWTCEANGDCSFLKGGEERGWNFDMERQRIAKLESEKSGVQH